MAGDLYLLMPWWVMYLWAASICALSGILALVAEFSDGARLAAAVAGCLTGLTALLVFFVEMRARGGGS